MINHEPINSKNYKVVESFFQFCNKHPELRFWQALRAWGGFKYILTSTHFESEMFDKEIMKKKEIEVCDTFYWKGKKK